MCCICGLGDFYFVFAIKLENYIIYNISNLNACLVRKILQQRNVFSETMIALLQNIADFFCNSLVLIEKVNSGKLVTLG